MGRLQARSLLTTPLLVVVNKIDVAGARSAKDVMPVITKVLKPAGYILHALSILMFRARDAHAQPLSRRWHKEETYARPLALVCG